MKDFYKILGVSRNASAAELKKAYRKLAKKYHPDHHKGDKQAEDKFKSISEAYDILGNTKKRQQYDQYGQWTHGGARADPGQAYRQHSWTSGGSGPNDFSDIFDDLFGMKGFGGRARAQQSGGFNPFAQAQPQDVVGRDVEYTMDIDFLEAVTGTTATIALKRGGKTSRIKVKIPAGIKDGGKIRLVGKGESSGIGRDGDLLITLNVRPHKYFSRKDNDIYVDVPISVSEAILGSTIKVPTVNGLVNLKIPAGTSSGTKLRLKGKGAPHAKGKGHGDQYVLVKIVLPKKIDENLKQLAQEIAEKAPYKAREGTF